MLFHYVADHAEQAWRCGDLFRWMAAREFDVRIDRTWPLSDAARAHRYIEGGQHERESADPPLRPPYICF